MTNTYSVYIDDWVSDYYGETQPKQVRKRLQWASELEKVKYFTKDSSVSADTELAGVQIVQPQVSRMQVEPIVPVAELVTEPIVAEPLVLPVAMPTEANVYMLPVYIPVYVPVVVTQAATVAPVLYRPVEVSKPVRPTCQASVFKTLSQSKPEVSTYPIHVGRVSKEADVDMESLEYDPYYSYRHKGELRGRLIAKKLLEEKVRQNTKHGESPDDSDYEYHAALMIESPVYKDGIPFGRCYGYTGKARRVYKAGFAHGFRTYLDELGWGLCMYWEQEQEKREYEAKF